FCLATLARLGSWTPIAVRLALRDLSRYRARSGSALAAISIGILIAVIISVASAARFANVLDYIGPNLTSNQLIVYTPNGAPGRQAGPASAASPGSLRTMEARAHSIASALGSHAVVEPAMTTATLLHNAGGRNWNGPVYVATPQLLRAFGISASQVSPTADILTSRPRLAGTAKMLLVYGNYFDTAGGDPNRSTFPCPKGTCLANPSIQEVSALPSGTSAPNTVITEHAVQKFHLSPFAAGWLIQTANPLTSAQIHDARLAAGAAGMTVETRSSAATSATIINWATVFGIVLALAILAMSVGLIRSETASDLRTLAATGASGRARRTIPPTTAGWHGQWQLRRLLLRSGVSQRPQ